MMGHTDSEVLERRPATRLELCLLGSFQATLDGDPVAVLRSDRTRALLAYLAVEADRTHRREALAALLWGESSDKAARASLRVSLHNLRQFLEPLTAPVGDRPILTVTRQSVSFHSDSTICWLDVAEFDALLAACHAHPHQDLARCPVCIRRLVRAATLYHGDFLAGLVLPSSPGFDEWRLLQQEMRHQQMLAVLETLATCQSALGNYREAQEYARRQLALEPWREETHRQLMQLLALSGQRCAALAHYETCRRVLAEELGVEPAAQTQALYEQILAGELKHDQSEMEAVLLPYAPVPLTEPIPCATDFVGREKELSLHKQHLASQNLAVLHGFAGTGKTALAAQLAAERQQRGHPVIWITFCADVNTDLDSFLGLLACALAELDDAKLHAFLAASAQELHPYPVDARIHFAVNCLSASHATLCLDDVHLVEHVPAIQRFLNVLVPRQQPARAPLIVASRSKPAFVQGRHIAPLPGLNDEDARQLLHNAGLAWLDDAAFVELVQRTEGNPAFLKFFVTWTRSSGVAELPGPERVARARGFIGQLGRSLASSNFLLGEVLSALDSTERSALQRMALYHESLSLTGEALAILLPDLDPIQADMALAQLERRNLLLRESDAATYRLHDLVRSYILARMEPPPAQQAELHRTLACRYEESDAMPESQKPLSTIAGRRIRLQPASC
jgi:DNA-binding SARP family transcriptional activator